MGQYWVRRGEDLYGPMTGTELKAATRSGQVVASDVISKDQVRWVAAGKVPGLEFPGHAPVAAPAVAPPPVQNVAGAYASPYHSAPYGAAPPPDNPYESSPYDASPHDAAHYDASSYDAPPQPFHEPAAPAPGYPATQPARRSRFPRAIVIAAVVVVMLVSAGVVAWRMRGADARQAVDLTPPDTAGIVFINVSAVRDEAMEQLKTHQAALGDRYTTISKLVETADWVAIYVPKELGPGAEPLAVIRADWSRAEVDALANLDGTSLTAASNGRYTFGGQTIVLGSEASDLDDGLVLFLPRRSRDADIVSQLGKGREGISEVVGSADTSAPFWAAVQVPAGANAPFVSVAISLNTRGQGEGVITFASEKEATELAEMLQPQLSRMVKEVGAAELKLDVKQEGKLVRISQTADLEITKVLGDSVVKSQQQAQRMKSQANLRQIAIAFQVRQNELKLPQSLSDLLPVLDNSTALLVSPVSGRPAPAVENGKLVGETDYIYTLDGVSITASAWQRIGRSRMILFYERPENYRGEGTNVAFANGMVQFVPTAEFERQLQETRQAIEQATKSR